MANRPPLWQCPSCGRRFANRNQTHSCGNHDLEHHFNGKAELVRNLFGAFLKLLEQFGPVTVLPEKTRIAFQVRMSFAQLTVRKSHVNGHLVLSKPVQDRRFTKIETISPRNHVHHFRLTTISDLDRRFATFARAAYAVGCQKHLAQRAAVTGRKRK